MRYVMLRLFTCCVAVLLLADVCIAQNRGRDEEHPVISRGTPQTSAGKTMAGIKGGASGKDLILELSLNVGTPDQPRRVPVSAAEAGAAKQGTLTITASVDCAVLVLQKDGKGVWQNAGGKKRLSLNAARSVEIPTPIQLEGGREILVYAVRDGSGMLEELEPRVARPSEADSLDTLLAQAVQQDIDSERSTDAAVFGLLPNAPETGVNSTYIAVSNKLFLCQRFTP